MSHSLAEHIVVRRKDDQKELLPDPGQNVGVNGRPGFTPELHLATIWQLEQSKRSCSAACILPACSQGTMPIRFPKGARLQER